MNIDALLKQVKKGRTKQAEGGTESQIPQELPVDPATELPKNIVAEGQAGDEQKIEELLTAIEQGGEAKGAAESIMTAKIAEEMASLDLVIIEKQAEHFGVKMADAFAQRLIEINNPPISEKQAEEMVKQAAEEGYARWFNAGTALWDGYVTKAAEFGTDGGAGIIDNGGQPVPAEVNQSEVDVFADDLAGYLASEFGGEEEEGKSASEKAAGLAELARKIKGYLGSAGSGLRSVGRKTLNFAEKHPVVAGAGLGLGYVGAAEGASMGMHALGGNSPSDVLRAQKQNLIHPFKAVKTLANADRGMKQSSDKGAILDAFTAGVITKKEAAEKLLSLR